MTIPNTKLPHYIARIENLEGQRYDLKLDIDEIYAEAKEAGGYDIPAMRELVRRRRIDAEKLQQRERTIADYAEQLDMFGHTPVPAIIEEEDRTPPFTGAHAAGA